MKKPRILFFDIETMANLARVWGKWEQNVIAYERHWYMLCYGYKWLDEKTTRVVALPDFPEAYKRDKYNDGELVKSLWKLFDQADIIVAHNGNSFDIKKSNARFIIHKLAPPSPYRTIDTKLVARKHFKFDSNKLDDLGDYFKIGRKINTGGWELWQGCEDNNPKAWAKMKRYNKQDVILLEKVYLAMLPYMTNHPNLAVMKGERACPNCGSSKIQKRGFSYSGMSVFQSWYCWDCESRPRSPLKNDKQIR